MSALVFDDKFITRDEALKELGVGSRALYNYVRDGKIKANKKNARTIYYSLKSIMEFKGSNFITNCEA